MTLFTRLRARRAVRHVAVALTLTIAMLAGVAVATITVDLGPHVRELGERQFAEQIKRPVHIGGLKIHLLRGRVVVDDLRIDGLKPSDRPFFTAKQISIGLDWSSVVRRKPEFVITSVEMTDWNMLVEKWEDANNFPKFTNDEPAQPPGPKRFTTTLKYLRAWRGQFAYEDHESPWSIVAPNIDLNISNLPEYHGTAVFSGGTVRIQSFKPMWVNMHADFSLDGPKVRLSRLAFQTDGAETVASGGLDFSRWPEQSYEVKSRVHFPRMREIFFADEPWTLFGDGNFDGTFRLFKGGHDLSGRFDSALMGVNAYRFPSLRGSLQWTNATFDVRDASAKLYGGDARFTYGIRRTLPSDERRTATFDVTFERTSLAQYTDFEALRGVHFDGAAWGHVRIAWPLGLGSKRHGDFQLTVAPSPGVVPMAATLSVDEENRPAERLPLVPLPLPAHLPIAGGVSGRFDEQGVEVDPSLFITERTYVAFRGSTAWGDRSQFSFHVASRDWQEADQVLVGIIRDFGGSASPVAVGGRGTFDGTMTGAFRQPRVEGDFSARHLWAWDSPWGTGSGHVVIANSYVTVTNGLVLRDGSEIHADGLFSIGYPRDDGGQEIDARFRVVRRDLATLRHAFKIDDYPVEGFLTGDFHLTGAYTGPVGFGGMTVDEGTAYGEPFSKATASLRFEEPGVRLDALNIEKDTGVVTGAAFVGWDGTYSFNADGRRIPVERLENFRYARAPLTGIAQFSAAGNGTFEAPRYDVRFRVNDLFIADEGVGQVTGSLAVRGRELSGDVDVASPRLALTGTGKISLAARTEADLTFRFHDSSLDPYVRLFEPRLSPFTTAVASGSVRIVGDPTDFNRLLVETTVDNVDMRLFDYALHNDAPVRIALDKNDVRIQALQLVGEDTRLRLSGRVGLRDSRIALQVAGDANLGILQGFFRSVRGSGRAELAASIDGPLHQPQFSGRATIAGGRVRHLLLPNALDAINGTIQFDAAGVRLDGVTATMGGGPVQFGGRIGFDGYVPGDLNLVIMGQDMRLRYPEGIRSVIDADLALRGNFRAPVLGGSVMVKSALWTRRIDATGNLFDLAGAARGSSSSSAASPAGPSTVPAPAAAAALPASAVPLRFDVQILVPSTLRVETNVVRLQASAEMTLRGTYDRPVLLGHADVDRGQVVFEGRRYRVTRGSIDLTNPNRIDPFFDVEAETNVRVTGQTFRVTVSAAGTAERLTPKLESDPPLPTADVLALLFSDVQRSSPLGGDIAPELRARSGTNQTETDILKARATQALTSPISAEVGKVMEQTFGVDTFQLTPSFINPYSTQTSRLNPTARVTIGKQISERAYLTFSRSLNTTFNDQIILLEYDATDRWYWVLSRNEDQQTYAVEFRVRHSF